MTLVAPGSVAAVQKRTILTLVATQAVGAMGITIGIATASLLARDLSGSESMAGLSQTTQVLGAAVAAYVLGRVMDARGRRYGLLAGYLLGAAGGLLAVVAGVVGSMTLLLVGAVLLGATTAANNGARYAATDLAPASSRARALSVVVWATTFGAVIGPNLTGVAELFTDAVGIPVLTGPFALGAVAMLAAALVVGVFLRPDPLLVAREGAPPASPSAVEPVETTSWRRAITVIRARPALAAAVVGQAAAHATMVAVMVMTPLHMEHGGAGLEVIGLVISGHVLGMFAFAPIAGWLADRVGRADVMALGGGVLLMALVLCAAAPQGSSGRIFVGLFLLGLGWSLATIAAATSVADHTPIEVRADVQGTADLIMGVAAAAAGALSGVVVDVAGYPALALCAIVLVVVLFGAAYVGRRSA
ncbi:MFS transporter [Nocardioides albus]|uniref:MFS family permease n=1 Tax=Nocardioides albus TaxID=1841 RepID=A0A7W5A550_9ACTN|nr:MFS transporter [Nocardioides albus]MBB3089643.1 MFS family permease [Nocardioides albus]GGU30431.1 tetracycline resistance protein [Nocardioides albus]